MAKLFFKPPGPPKTLRSRNFVYLDGGGFRAIAVALMDQSMQFTGEQSWMQAILARYSEFFPERMPVWSINSSRDLELQQLTYTLARIAVDELCAHPCDYSAAFKHTEHQDIESWACGVMHSPHKHALAALANAVQLPLEIYSIDAEREIAVRTCYSVKNLGVCAARLLMYGGLFFPKVDQPGVWRGIERLGYLPIDTCKLTLPATLSVIDETLASSDLARWQLYQESLRKLQSLFLSENDCRQVYQQNWRDITQINLLECEHGLQDYFARLSIKYGNPEIISPPWISAVARAITLDACNYLSLNRSLRPKEA